METIIDPFSQILWQDPSTLPAESVQPVEEPVREQLHRNENRFPTFLAHVSSLEKKGRKTETVFIDEYILGFADRSFIDRGATFSVERTIAIPNPQTIASAPAVIRQKRVVALKTVRIQSQSDEIPKAGWDHVLLEIRALLHETLRYHPNIVRLIGLCWGPNGASGNVYPQLVIEYAEHGTLEDLQTIAKSPLPFAVKQKLLYDAGKGLSIIHACSIIHGDIKRQNVLIFADNSSHGPYMAKLADFGGAVYGSEKYDSYRFICKTPRYAAPETDGIVTAEAAKLCDVYSFGLLVCETFADGDLTGLHPEFSPRRGLKGSSVTLAGLKASGRLLHRATSLIQDYFDMREANQTCADMVQYVLEQTIQKNLRDRSLARAQAALRGVPLDQVDDYLNNVDQMNRKWKEVEDNEPPGKHGISADGAGLFLGTVGATYDPQNNTPGFRPKVKPPVNPGFVFEPEKLKKVLSWQQQQHILEALQAISDSGDKGRDVELHKLFAAWFLFRCHVAEFGTSLDPEKACSALRRAASDAVTGSDQSSGFEYLAASCVWRVSQALGQTPPELFQVFPSSLQWATLRGGWQASQDLEDALPLLSEELKLTATETYLSARRLANYFSGVPGSLAFLPRHLRRDFSVENAEQLEQELKEELGELYQSSLKTSPSRTSQQANPFDLIFVNSRGHGILHMAAARGQAKTIEYLINTFKLNIDLPNQDCEETPLVCACRNAHLEASLALLRHGADPKGHPLGQDTPLHWLWRFKKEEMKPIAKGLIEAGALIDAASGGMRAEVLKAHADWEGTMSISTTPLGRCVLFQNITAAEVLIELGADPMIQVEGISPIQLAAVLALPKFLRLFLSHEDAKIKAPTILNNFEDLALLKMAEEQKAANRDTFSLLSRLIRNGPRYRSDVEETFSIFREQRELLGDTISPSEPSGEALCMQIRQGNRDIVEVLLKMGHRPSGSPDHRPMREAVMLNNYKVFRMLRDYGGQIESYPEWPRTLLHDLAARPASSPPGTIIAEELIASGLSVQEHPPGTRPPVVEAILLGYYDLANLLLDNGARIGSPYQLGPELPRISIFKELLQQRTEMYLSILQCLLRTSAGTDSQELVLRHSEKFDFIVDHIGHPIEQQTAWNILATSPPARKNVVESEVYMAQVRCLLSESSPFASKECINFEHSKFGTALCQAVLYQNHFLVGKLLLSGADPTLRSHQNFGPVEKYFRDGSPVNLALGCYEVAIDGWSETVPDTIIEDMRGVINELEAIPDYPEDAVTRGEDLRKRHENLLRMRNDERAMHSQMANLNLQQGPVDLSNMSAVQATQLDESQREMFQATETIIRWMFDSQRYGTIGRAEMTRIAEGENA
ncbi:serine threonine kinase [Fusarium beomiforme]|uniref:Serine threonine kinase n=1 Tax=Fusarium beomiforme TaxID=44412 RepID=A0A9P5ABG0_9HYPO|nr:serine threonine kinase [Fusarium beomiforme]